jgi:peptidyl-prolyl cis-trans isomerase SurA
VKSWAKRPGRFNRLFLPALIALLVGGLGRAASAETLDRVIASVDGHPITTHDLKVYAASNGISVPNPDDPGSSPTGRAVIRGLISQAMLEQESNKYADKVDDSQVDNYLRGLEQQNHLTDRQFRDQLSQNGMSYDEFRGRARLELEKMVMMQDLVRRKIVISQDEIKRYYEQHQDEFKVSREQIKLAQVLIAVPDKAAPEQVAAAKAKAEQIRDGALKDADFGDLARRYSDDTSKDKGGELGTFAPDEIMDEIYAAIKDLKPGEISQVVRSKYGFHILKVEEHVLPGVKPLSEVSEEIRGKLVSAVGQQQLQTWIDNDLAKEHHVESFY